MAEQKKGFDNSPWDGSGVKASMDVSQLRKVCALDLNGYPGQEGDPVKDLCYLPIKSTPDGLPNAAAVKAAGAGPRSISRIKKPAGVPQEYFAKKRKSAAGKLVSLWERAFKDKAPASLYKMAGLSRAAESMMPRNSNELEDIIMAMVLDREDENIRYLRSILASEIEEHEHQFDLQEAFTGLLNESAVMASQSGSLQIGTIGFLSFHPTREEPQEEEEEGEENQSEPGATS